MVKERDADGAVILGRAGGGGGGATGGTTLGLISFGIVRGGEGPTAAARDDDITDNGDVPVLDLVDGDGGGCKIDCGIMGCSLGMLFVMPDALASRELLALVYVGSGGGGGGIG